MCLQLQHVSNMLPLRICNIQFSDNERCSRYDIECASVDVNQDRKRRRSGKDGEVEAALKNWYWEQIQRGDSGRLTGDRLKKKAEEIAQELGKTGFVATNGWFQRWRKRENISTGRSQEDRSAFFECEDGPPQATILQQQEERHFKIPQMLNDKIAEDTKTQEETQTTAPSKDSVDSSKDSTAPIIQELAFHDNTCDSDSIEQPTITQPPPTAGEMLRALDVLKRGILHYNNTNIQIHYDYQAHIENLLKSTNPK